MFPGLSASTVRREAERLFHDTFPDIALTYYDPTGGDPSIDYATAMERMMGDLMVGKGPDLILGNCDYDRIAGTDVTKQARSGLFVDLSSYLQEDDRFRDTPDALFASGQVKDAQYVIPLRYNLGVHLSSGNVLDACGLEEADFFGDMAADLAAIQGFMTGYAPRSVFEGADYFSAPKCFFAYLWPSAERLRDGLDTPEFRQAVEILLADRQKSEGLLTNAKWESYTYAGETYRALSNLLEVEASSMLEGHAPWLGGEFHDAMNMALFANAFDPMGGTVLAAISNDLGGCTAQITDYAVVSRHSTRVKEAYTYLDAFYDALSQSKDLGTGLFSGTWQSQVEQLLKQVASNGLSDVLTYYGELPWFNEWREEKEADYRAQMEAQQAAYAESHPGEPLEEITVQPGQFDRVPRDVPAEFLAQLEAWTENLNGAFYSYVPYEIVEEAFAPYFAGEDSFESCLSEARFQLDLYLSE